MAGEEAVGVVLSADRGSSLGHHVKLFLLLALFIRVGLDRQVPRTLLQIEPLALVKQHSKRTIEVAPRLDYFNDVDFLVELLSRNLEGPLFPA